MLRVRFPTRDEPVRLYIDASADSGEGGEVLFGAGRVVPVYYYFPGERRGYVLRVDGSSPGAIPNTEGEYRILLSVRGAEVDRLKKAVGKLYEDLGVLEGIPEVFWPQLGVLTAQRGFRLFMVTELYLATRQKWLLQEELHDRLDVGYCGPTGRLGPGTGSDPRA